jgi:LysM repeat protein
VADLMAANGLGNPDQLYAGQVLVIPAPGSAPAAAPAAPAATGGPSGGVHVVQPGETLFRIGQRYGVTVTDLAAANGLLNAAQIYSGQQLVIPGPGAATSTPATAPAAASPALTGTHIVQPGETLGDIAARYGTGIAELAQANSLSNPSLIYSGQALLVPGAGTNAPAARPPAAAPGTHVVQQGETLFRIALAYGVTVADLMAANGLGSNTIYSGQTLAIPGGGSGGGGPAPIPAANAPNPTITDGKQIVVDLSQQMVFAFENGQLLRQFVVSTGLPQYPTVTGDYAIYVKYTSTRMTGPDYDLPNVPWTMYFYRGYGLHGTYWHNNFGQPMSHGCVNMRTPEAEWLFNWAPVGTPVRVTW